MASKVNMDKLLQYYHAVRKKKLLDRLHKNVKERVHRSDWHKAKDLERQRQIREKKKKKRREIISKASERKAKLWAQKYRNRIRRLRKRRRIYIRTVKRPRERMRRLNGDVRGLYNIIITRNKKKIAGKGTFRWMSSVYKRYDELIEENKNVVFPTMFRTEKDDKLSSVEYEILIVKRIDDNVETNETVFKDDNGFAVKVNTDNPNKMVLARHAWRVERQFVVYGYHPLYDKKTAPWIISNIILKDLSYENMKQILTWNQYLIIENDYDFDFVQCKAPKESAMLYNILFDLLSENKYLFFTGTVRRAMVDKWRERFREKTGWSDKKLLRCNNI